MSGEPFHCVAFIDGKTFRNKDALKSAGCRWNQKTGIWTRKCLTQAEATEFQALLTKYAMTARIVLADGTQTTFRPIEKCPDAKAVRFAVIAHHGPDIAFVKSFIAASMAERLAGQLARRYSHRKGFAAIVVTEYQPSTMKWAEMRQALQTTERSNHYHSGSGDPATGATSPKP